ncbi:HTH domain-containing protein [Haladaptatus pallidirubidus]|uniref:HTH domain-containing protein n=1 Tax=Haladaptatus pallidirubidus TaxID=1008152 RepID=UPI0035F04441
MTDEAGDRERDNKGQFTEAATDDEILATMRDAEFPAVTARWIADTLEVDRTTIHRRLETLQESGTVKRGSSAPVS